MDHDALVSAVGYVTEFHVISTSPKVHDTHSNKLRQYYGTTFLRNRNTSVFWQLLTEMLHCDWSVVVYVYVYRLRRVNSK